MLESNFRFTSDTTERNIMRSFGFWFIITLGLIAFDQTSKFFAQYFKLPIFLNINFAFSIPLPSPIMYGLYVLVLGSAGWYLYHSWKKINRIEKISWILILAGGLSNIGERLVLGHVRDFIPILSGILNVADLYIISGLILLLVYSKK